MSFRSPILALLLVVSFIAPLTGCSTLNSNASQNSGNAQSDTQYTNNVLFDNALWAINDERYFDAIEQFRDLETRFPYGAYGELAKLNLVYANYQVKDYPSAINKANQHIRLYPTSQHQDYVLYLRGLAQFYADLGFARRHLPLNISEQDLSSLEKAFDDFRVLIKKFPNSAYSTDSQARMVYIRNLLAEEKSNIAKHYLKQGSYTAAINRAEEILQAYPNTPANADALAIKSVAYGKLNQNEISKQYQQLLVENFPNYTNLNNGDITLQTPNEVIDWLEIISFGLLPVK